MAAAIGGCGGEVALPASPPPAARAPTTVARAAGVARPVPRPPLCRARRARPLGRVADPGMTELSGLVRSRAAAGVSWAQQDSGHPPVLTALGPRGAVLGHVAVTGAANVDWEDLAAGAGPDGVPALFVGDTGDNDERRASVQVYRVPEPPPGAAATSPATRLDLRYPDGAHDAEALLADPIRNELLVVTKALGAGRVYAVPRGTVPGPAVPLRRGPAVPLSLVTAGDVSRDGRIVALRTYDTLAVWRRRGAESLVRTLDRAPTCVVGVDLAAEGQGEALALDRRGRTAVTAPEGPQPLLRRYGRP